MAKTPRVLSGQVAAITGGARGIGRCTAQALLAQGMRVAIGDLDYELAQKTAAELGEHAHAYPLNVVERESTEAFVAAVEEELGAIDVYVNNAGIMQLGYFLQEDDATTRRQIDINVHGVLNGMKAILPRFQERHSGHLVNVASTAGKAGFPGGATYCGTKHFVVGVSEAMRLELADTPIEISCVMPVIVNTELASGVPAARGVKNVQPEDVAAEIVSALQKPRFDVFVPRSVGSLFKVMNTLPRPAREGMARALKADRVLLEGAENASRKAYELRASQSGPGLEPGAQTKQLEETTTG